MFALEAMPRRAPAPVLTVAAPAAHGRVLLIEDDEDLNEVLSIRLGIEGFRVDRATDGVEGLERAIRGAPDAIVMDLTLPRLSGLRMLRLLRSIPVLAPVPVIVITGVDPGHLTEAVSELESVKRILFKPINAKRLARVIVAVLESQTP